MFNRRKKRKAAAALELALMLPVFLLLIIGILEFGRAMMIHQVITNSAREAVRIGIVSGATDDEMTSSINEYLDGAHIAESGREIEIIDKEGNATSVVAIKSHDPITLVIRVPFHENSFGMTSWFTDASISTQVTMRRE